MFYARLYICGFILKLILAVKTQTPLNVNDTDVLIAFGIVGICNRLEKIIDKKEWQQLANARDLKLDSYGISKYAYRELKNFCLQYGEKKQKLAAIRGLSAVTYEGMPHGTDIGDPTQVKAERAERLEADIKLIEQTAIEADSGIYQSLIANVSSGISYFDLIVPCDKKYFYEKRRKFFYILAQKRGMI